MKHVPEPGALSLDHVAHFVPDIDAASTVLERLGFTLTPFSAQSHRLTQDGPLAPAGTGNRCVMLRAGYLEFLTPTGDTPHAAQLRSSISRYTGVHLIAFGTSTPEQDYTRLQRAGFEALAPVALQRPISTPAGENTARFTVVRVPPGIMPEGRIQYCAHHTPELVWQARWTTHANSAVALAEVWVCVDDAEGTALRYSRFTGVPAKGPIKGAWTVDTARGTLHFVSAEALKSTLAVLPPTLPWIAGYTLRCGDIGRAERFAKDAGFEVLALDSGGFTLRLPDAIGGVMVFRQASERGSFA